jgi:hypothetical protein
MLHSLAMGYEWLRLFTNSSGSVSAAEWAAYVRFKQLNLRRDGGSVRTSPIILKVRTPFVCRISRM